MPVSRTSPTSPDDVRRTPAHGAPPSPARPSAAPPSDPAGDVVRWAVFSCVLVPVILVWYGTSLAGAAGTALGLAAVTGACRVLLRQSERGAARLSDEAARQRVPHRGRHGRSGWQGTGGAHGKSGSGAHRGGRHTAGSTPVD
ncbi:hypothetical protein AB0D78_06990 [Streptomyces avermitilis]|uniref:hypothetical protein n=1 Tax=Streptomyces avermitilis TaxID=33903 RepID=UPI0033C7679C